MRGVTITGERSVLVTSLDGILYSLGTPVNGSGTVILLWKYDAGSPIYGAPRVDSKGNIYFGASDTGVHSLTALGNQRWIFPTGGNVDSTPALSPDETRVYFGSWSNKVFALDAASGVARWNLSTNDHVDSSPAVDANGRVYFGCDDGNIYACNGTTGAILWTYLTDGVVYSSPAIGLDNVIYVASFDAYLYAINSQTGQLRWRFLTGNLIESSPVLGANGVVYFTSFDGR